MAWSLKPPRPCTSGFVPLLLALARDGLLELGLRKRGTPLDRCWSPLGHPWTDLLVFQNKKISHLFKYVRFQSSISILRKQWHLQQKHARSKIANPHTSFSIHVVLTNSRKSETPDFCLIGGRRNSRKDNNKSSFRNLESAFQTSKIHTFNFKLVRLYGPQLYCYKNKHKGMIALSKI